MTSSYRVIICDDEGLSVLRWRATLVRMGFQVVATARTGQEAIDAVETHRPDAILMDVEMPELDGISATRQIMESHPTAVLIMSAYSEPQVVQSAREAGACGYLVKPVTDAQVGPALLAAIEAFQNRTR